MGKIELSINEYTEVLYALRFKRKHKRNQIKNLQKNKDDRVLKQGEERYYNLLNAKLDTVARLDNVIEKLTKLIEVFNE